MSTIRDYPLVVFGLSFLVLAFAVWIGAAVLRRWRPLDQNARDDYGVILGATLTLLGLIIGFSFAMAIGRYDQRKNYEEAEANAIGTEYLRADLLPAEDTTKVRDLLRRYLDQRVLFYSTRDEGQIRQINARTAQLQVELWNSVLTPARALPTPMVALAVSGMNDVLNSQGYAQAAAWNRIPRAAWLLMGVIAICGNVLIGYGTRNVKPNSRVLLHLVLPFVVAISFFLIADIDSPSGGVILVEAQNLSSLAQSLRAP